MTLEYCFRFIEPHRHVYSRKRKRKGARDEDPGKFCVSSLWYLREKWFSDFREGTTEKGDFCSFAGRNMDLDLEDPTCCAPTKGGARGGLEGAIAPVGTC